MLKKVGKVARRRRGWGPIFGPKNSTHLLPRQQSYPYYRSILPKFAGFFCATLFARCLTGLSNAPTWLLVRRKLRSIPFVRFCSFGAAQLNSLSLLSSLLTRIDCLFHKSTTSTLHDRFELSLTFGSGSFDCLVCLRVSNVKIKSRLNSISRGAVNTSRSGKQKNKQAAEQVRRRSVRSQKLNKPHFSRLNTRMP